MQPHTCKLSAFTLSTAIFFGTAAIAGDLPKEGTFTATSSFYGTYKATLIGKELILNAFDENGLSVGSGLLDHMTWHCWGLYDITNGKAQHHGYCVATDPAGDQIGSSFASDGRYPADAKSFSGAVTFISGTGKYAGISGGDKYVGHAPEFRTAAEGTFVEYTTIQGSYKLP